MPGRESKWPYLSFLKQKANLCFSQQNTVLVWENLLVMFMKDIAGQQASCHHTQSPPAPQHPLHPSFLLALKSPLSA